MGVDAAFFLEKDGAWLWEDLPPGFFPSRFADVPDGRGVCRVALSSWMPENHPGLLHIAYLARLRRLVGAVPAEWEPFFAPETDLSGKVPDAFWHRPEGSVPVEVDLGHYSRERLTVKLVHYHRAYGRQVWGVRSPALSQRLHQLAQALAVPVEVYVLEGGEGERFLRKV